MGLGPIFVGIRAFESHPSHLFIEHFSQASQALSTLFIPDFLQQLLDKRIQLVRETFSNRRAGP